MFISRQTALPSSWGAHSSASAKPSHLSTSTSHRVSVPRDRYSVHSTSWSLRSELCSKYDESYLVEKTISFFLQLLQNVLQPFELSMKFSDTWLIINQMILCHFVLACHCSVVLVKCFVVGFELTGLISFVIFKFYRQLVELIIFNSQGCCYPLKLLTKKCNFPFILCSFSQQLLIISFELTGILLVPWNSISNLTFVFVDLSSHGINITLMLSNFAMSSVKFIIFSIQHLLKSFILKRNLL